MISLARAIGVYLDHNATTPLDPRVRTAVEPWLADKFGNPGSRDHVWGWDSFTALECARAAVADAVRTPPGKVFFVSGATEALATILRSYALRRVGQKTIITSAAEHDAVLTMSRYLARQGHVALRLLPVDEFGRVDLDELRRAVHAAPGSLVAIMAANNEIGTVYPVRQIAQDVHAANGWYLSDTTQAFGRMTLDLDGVDFAAISSHKIHGLPGGGALVATGDDIEPMILGGGQEGGVRGGTQNVPAVVGLGEACRLVTEQLEEDVRRMTTLRDRLEEAILSGAPGTWVNGDRSNRLSNTTNIGFKGLDARTLIREMHDIAVSTRSACSSGNSGPSHVLKAIGLSDDDAYSCVRFSLGRFTTEAEIDYAVQKVTTSVHKLRRRKSIPA